ncbi:MULTISPECIES: amidohydrolase family protein [unclassified Bradyrhizobium]|uniref:amidohydrolase family protein n=1 Tax=unclassified Bradyrhizobium TaxID=2631580 RepID=UPI0003F73551|nr:MULTISPECIES: amidohydrolase family protein [unclassified Bradyrhizobium]MCP3461211.1 amidohydrolase family protein [Bradyrhizobium sp. CCGUVB23]
MRIPFAGAIDCDLHPPMPSMAQLLPYLDDYWRDQITNRAIDRMSFAMMSYPPNAPVSARADWRAAQTGRSELDTLRTDVLDAFGLYFGIANVMHGAIALHNDDMAAAICRAVNDWLRAEWLDREPRLRGSILVTPQDPAQAVAEIERLAPDQRFVQVLLPVMGEKLLGRREFFPLYEAAERHGLVVAVHAGSTYRYAPTIVGWPSYQFEDYVAQAQAFANQTISLVVEGVFHRFPRLKVVMLESGVSWLPMTMWRTDKTWRGARPEVPWVDRWPSEIIREHLRFTIQPFDAPDATAVGQTIDRIGTDQVLLFSTDYPHWQFDGADVLPDGLSPHSLMKILVANALETYPRLAQVATTLAAEQAKEDVR